MPTEANVLLYCSGVVHYTSTVESGVGTVYFTILYNPIHTVPCRVAEPEPVGARADLKFDLEPEQFFGNDFKMFIFLVNYTYFCIINSTF